jgi:tetratricopeptide (TPR) repeat protein
MAQRRTRRAQVQPNSPTPDPSVINRHRTKVAACLFVMGVALYARTSSFEYTLDDRSVLTENRLTTAGLAGIPSILTTSYRAGYDPGLDDGLYRPLSLIALAIEWQVWPNAPHVYHLANVVLYGASVGMLFLLLMRLLGESGGATALTASLLFATHPVHTEVVASIKSLDEILALLFSLVASWGALTAAEIGTSWRTMLIVGVASWLAVLSKESAAVIVILVPCLVWTFRSIPLRRAATLGMATAVGVFAAGLMRVIVLGGQWTGPTTIDPLDNVLVTAPNVLARTATAFHLIARDMWLLLVPGRLSYDYSFQSTVITGWSDPGAWIGAVVLAGLCTAAIAALRRRRDSSGLIRLAGFGAGALVVALIPISNLLFLIGTAMAERLLYLPSLGFVLIAVGLLTTVSSKWRAPRALAATLSVIVVLYAARTITRESVWRSDETLFAADVITAPESARIQYDVGLSLVRDRWPRATADYERTAVLDEALAHLREATRLMPAYPDAHNQTGVALEHLGRHEEAVAEFRDALTQGGPQARYLVNLSVSYLSLHRFDDAIGVGEQATRMSPNDANAWLNLGTAYGSSGAFDKSIAALLTAERLAPENPITAANLAVTYRRMGNTEKAAEYQARAASLRRRQ